VWVVKAREERPKRMDDLRDRLESKGFKIEDYHLSKQERDIPVLEP
jgi:uncharacterized protein with GYD domain